MPRGRCISIILFAALLCCGTARQVAAADPDLSGYWSGVMNAGPTKLKVVFQLKRNKDGTWTTQLHSIDQGALGMATDETTFKDGELKITVKGIGGAYAGKLSDDGTKFTGTWTQGGAALPFTVTHVAEVPELVRPQDPKQPYPYTEEQVTYDGAGGVKIAAALTHPTGAGPFPAVIITPDGDRNGEKALHHPLLVLADYLTRQGLAVLRSDDRGVGASTGDLAQETTPDRAADIRAALAYLKTRPDILPGKVGLIGYGEGGLEAPLVAASNKDVEFLVLMAAPGINGQQLMALQAMSITKAYGQGQGAGLQSLDAQAEIFDILNEEQPAAATEGKLRQVMTRLISASLPKVTKPGPQADAIAAMTKQIVDAQVKEMMKPETKFIMGYDPQETLNKVTCPVLAINGELDPFVPARQNLRGIRAALDDGGNKDHTVKSLPRINHQFQTATTDSPLESAKIKETIAPSVLALVGDWIQAHVGTVR